MVITDKRPSILFKQQADSEILLVIFGGIRQGLGLPEFEFMRVLSDLHCNKLYLRDFNQAWYHNGVDSDIYNIEKLLGYLENKFCNSNYKRIVFMGKRSG